jgi:hypothetical protein
MFPCLIVNNPCNISSGYIEFFRQVASRKKFFKLSYLSYLVTTKFPPWMLIAAQSVAPVFMKHISSIFFERSNEEMRRIYAGRIVAMMTNAHPSRNFSFMKFIRKSMRLYASWIHELAISAIKFTASPQPASRSFFNVFDEAFANIISHLKPALPAPFHRTLIMPLWFLHYNKGDNNAS